MIDVVCYCLGHVIPSDAPWRICGTELHTRDRCDAFRYLSIDARGIGGAHPELAVEWHDGSKSYVLRGPVASGG